MRPLAKSILSWITSLSLLLCVATIVFGVWGFRSSSEVRFEWIERHSALCLMSSNGTLYLIHSEGWADATKCDEAQRLRSVTPLTVERLIVFEPTFEQSVVGDDTGTFTVTYRGVRTNFLYLSFFSLLVPGYWCVARARRQRAPMRCDQCGYDLRATPGWCPECGKGVGP